MTGNILTVIISALDIFIMAFVIYKILMLLKDSRAMQLLKGVLILFAAYIVSGWLNLTTVHWILGKSWSVIVLGIAIIFQPELRNALEKLGRSHPLLGGGKQSNAMAATAAALEEAILVAANHKMGMLLVLQGATGLKQQMETGVLLDAKVSSELLLNLFFKNSPLHDGAAILSGNRVVAAGCIMPLTFKEDVASDLGTRHRAAIGTSEMSDALILVVSEETGVISSVRHGHIQRNLSPRSLRRTLYDFYNIPALKKRKKKQNV